MFPEHIAVSVILLWQLSLICPKIKGLKIEMMPKRVNNFLISLNIRINSLSNIP